LPKRDKFEPDGIPEKSEGSWILSDSPDILKVHMIYVIIGTVHIIACLVLIFVVLLQSGQAADLAGAFGGMGSQTVFGPRGSATVLSKATTWAAIIFMITSLSMAILGSRHSSALGSSVLDNRTTKTAPAATKQQQGQPKPQSAPAAPKK
jgi:preprotein translocase subunit SecG